MNISIVEIFLAFSRPLEPKQYICDERSKNMYNGRMLLAVEIIYETKQRNIPHLNFTFAVVQLLNTADNIISSLWQCAEAELNAVLHWEL